MTDTSGFGSKAIVVCRTLKFDRLARKAVKDLGSGIWNERVVKAEAARFADEIAARPKPLSVKVLDVVGFSEALEGHADDLEPIVLHQGKPQPVTATFPREAGDYWIGRAIELESEQFRIVSTLARKIAESALLLEAMMAAIEEADPEMVLSAMSCDPATATVELVGDKNGKIAARLPKWIRLGSR